MKNILILGAAGFIGQNLAERLKKNARVVGYDRFTAETDYPFIEGDFGSETKLEQILTGYEIDTVYHLISTTIPKADTSDIAGEVSDNVVPTLRLLEAMRHAGTARLVFVSSGGTVYGESSGSAHAVSDALLPICGYGMQKMVIEEYMRFYARRYGMDCRVARLSNPYGVPPKRPRGQGIIPIFMDRLLCGEPVTVFGDTVRDYIHIDDAVEALVRFGGHCAGKKLVNIGSGIPVRISEIVSLIEKLTGKTFTAVEHMPIRGCDVQESVLDIEETKKELDWQPRIDLESGILRTWEELKALRA